MYFVLIYLIGLVYYAVKFSEKETAQKVIDITKEYSVFQFIQTYLDYETLESVIKIGIIVSAVFWTIVWPLYFLKFLPSNIRILQLRLENWYLRLYIKYFKKYLDKLKK